MNERMKAGLKTDMLFRKTIFWIAAFISQLMFLSSSFVPDSDSDGINDCDDDCPNQSGPRSNNGCPSSSSKSISDSITTFIKFLFIFLLILTIIGIILFIWKRRQKMAASRTRIYDDDTRLY